MSAPGFVYWTLEGRLLAVLHHSYWFAGVPPMADWRANAGRRP